MAGRLEGRIALITGASRGIGAAVARRFAAEGAHLILTARTVGGLEEVDDDIQAMGGMATLIPADLKEMNQIDQMGGAIHQRFGRLDILVGNAATLGILSPVAHVAPAVWEEAMTLNATVNYRLIRSFDPLLRQSEAGRAIFVTSGAAQGSFPYWGPYAVGKAALEALVRTYAGEIAKTRVRANLIDPGSVRTALRAEAFPGEDPMKLAAPEDVTETFVTLAEPGYQENGTVVHAQ
ncbi:MAG: SDR family NAD(P)-dependent oxidoreductase [Rhodospirillaceae bacterium]|nr:SDR family NAD(P)-dependent oxidoreductase [Rhodospirillaceae bacterium]MDD9926590.1 SDR family NAD(P)-dependent oxidoreductase [Rhodospirillaceae bacterium]